MIMRKERSILLIYSSKRIPWIMFLQTTHLFLNRWWSEDGTTWESRSYNGTSLHPEVTTLPLFTYLNIHSWHPKDTYVFGTLDFSFLTCRRSSRDTLVSFITFTLPSKPPSLVGCTPSDLYGFCECNRPWVNERSKSLCRRRWCTPSLPWTTECIDSFYHHVDHSLCWRRISNSRRWYPKETRRKTQPSLRSNVNCLRENQPSS